MCLNLHLLAFERRARITGSHFEALLDHVISIAPQTQSWTVCDGSWRWGTKTFQAVLMGKPSLLLLFCSCCRDIYILSHGFCVWFHFLSLSASTLQQTATPPLTGSTRSRAAALRRDTNNDTRRKFWIKSVQFDKRVQHLATQGGPLDESVWCRVAIRRRE